MKRPKLSVVIITLNEEKNLPKTLGSIKEIADEIVVVDSGSTDKTVEIAKKNGAKVYTRKFDNYSNQKNFAAKKATGDWVLAIDADEEVTPELAREIESRITNHESRINAYSIPRKNIILGRFIRYTRWQPELDRHVWLWKKGKGKWKGDIHEELEVEGQIGHLIHQKIHYQYRTINEFMKMMNQYSELDANQRAKAGVRFSYPRLVFDTFYNFLVRFFYRLGFLDGWRGFVLSYLMAIYHAQVWIKVWEGESD